jgi:FkbM family methyltransferase
MKPVARFLRRNSPKSVRNGLFRLGLFMGPPVFPDLRNTLRALKDRGFSPKQAIDIGAYHGTWTATVKEIFPDCRFLMIEAQESKRSHLEKIASHKPEQLEVEIALLGRDDGTSVTFFEMETGSSVLEENSHFPRHSKTYTTKTLDKVAANKNIRECDILKLDVQGYELEILRGSATLLRNTKLVMLETSLIPVNKGCPLIAEVFSYMESINFQLYDIVSQIRRPDHVLWQTDLIFISRECKLLPEAKYWH